MTLHKTLGYLHDFGRPILILTMLIMFQRLGLLDSLLEKNQFLRIDSFNDILIATIFIVMGRWAVGGFVSKIWNHITPITDKATYIESELCYSISVALGGALFCILWVNNSLMSFPAIIGILILASWPVILFGWSIQIWREKLSPYIQTVQAEDNSEINDRHFWKRSFAYLIAALVFNLAIILCIQAILLVKTGTVHSWWSIASSCSILTFLTLVIFGRSVVALGHWGLTRMNIRISNEKRHYSLAYMFGYMIVLTVFTGLALFSMYSTNPESVLSWWAYGVAYLIIAFCAMLAGFSFGYFHTPPRQNTEIFN